MQQNKIAIIRDFAIANPTENDITDIRITLTPEPEFAEILTHYIDVIPAGTTIKAANLRLIMSTNFFAQLTEPITGQLKLEIVSGEIHLFQNSYLIDMLTFDQWSGISVLPEILSSFATPNHLSLAPLILRTADILEHRSFILSQIQELIECEAPIIGALIHRRIVSSWGFIRLGQRLSNYMDRLFIQLPFYRETETKNGDVYWLNEEQYRSYSDYRPRSDREETELPTAEIANGIKQIMTEQISMEYKDLARVVGQLFGFVKLRKSVYDVMLSGIEEAERRKYIVSLDNRVTIV
jgi:hypothetical protein